MGLFKNVCIYTAAVLLLWQFISCEEDPDPRPVASGDLDGDGDSDADADGDADTDADADTDSDTDSDSDSDGDTDGNSDADADGDGDGDSDQCGETNFEIEAEIVDMLIVLDRSNSMQQSGFWLPMGTAIKTVTSQMEQQINFGLIFFPGLSCSLLVDQCATSASPQVPIGTPDAVASISEKVSKGTGAGTCGGTPTAKTLKAALTHLDSVQDQNSRFVLLATDGAPNCNKALNCNNCTTTHTLGTCANSEQCLDDVETAGAAQDLLNAGYPVYVLGIGQLNKWINVMNDIASAGGTGQYYPANNTGDFLDALLDITGKVASCEFDLDWEDPSLPSNASDDPDKVNFYCKEDEADDIDASNVIKYDDGCADGGGWMWVDEDTVKFCDSACEELKQGNCKVVTATFGCETVIV